MALSQVFLDWEQKTIDQAQKQEAESLVLRQLTRRLGQVMSETEAEIRALSLPQLEDLGEALLDFFQPSDLDLWLRSRSVSAGESQS